MGIFRNNVNTMVDGRPVRVVGRSGPIRATWRLLEGDAVLEECRMVRGTKELVGTLSTGTEVRAQVAQSVFGPTTVTIMVDGETVAASEGFVA